MCGSFISTGRALGNRTDAQQAAQGYRQSVMMVAGAKKKQSFLFVGCVAVPPQSVVPGSSTQSLLHFWGKKSENTCSNSNAQEVIKRRSSCFTLNGKALCLSKMSIFPSVLHCVAGVICISKWMLLWCSEGKRWEDFKHACCLLCTDRFPLSLWLLR